MASHPPFPSQTSLAPKTEAAPDATVERLERRLARAMGRAIEEWRLLEEGDHVLVGISGGKDSYTLLQLLRRFQRRAPISFELTAVHLDQGHPGFDSGRIAAYLAAEAVRYRIVSRDTYSAVKRKLREGETPCTLCSRFRRRILYDTAAELDCNKLALGHHRDDLIETLLLNMFFSGRTAAMPARLEADEGRCTVIRPLVYATEADIAAYAARQRFPIEPCTVCGRTERDEVGALLDQLEARNPNVRGNLLSAAQNIVPSHLLDRRLPPPR
jgi:tRNA 2-thiocytidine biosynthesis protein TtcA